MFELVISASHSTSLVQFIERGRKVCQGSFAVLGAVALLGDLQ